MGKLSKCLQKSPTSLLQCWSQRHVEVVALEQISPVLVLRVKSSVCSLPTEQPVCESLTPSIAAVPRICHPLRRVRVRSGAWRVSGSGVFTQRESALCFTWEQTAGSGVFVWSDSVLMGCVPCLVRSDLDEENEDDQYWLWKLWAAILPPVLYGVDVILAGSRFVNRVLVPSCKLKPHKLFDVCHTM